MTRAEKWRYVIESLIGNMDDIAVFAWLNTHGPDLDKMVDAADHVRSGMIAS